ncbi:MAG TPA: hypothetical protein V6D47_03700 [Oscillatoriaceae cyanobacterium]
MQSNIIQFPLVEENVTVDPMLERALFLAEHDMLELTMTIPQAEPQPAKAVY